MQGKRGSILPFLTVMILLVAAIWLSMSHTEPNTYTYNNLVSAIKEGNVSSVSINQNQQVPTGSIKVTLKSPGIAFTYTINVLYLRRKGGKNMERSEKILICISGAPSNAKVIRSGAKIAKAFNGSLSALFVQPPDFEQSDSESKNRLMDNIHLAEHRLQPFTARMRQLRLPNTQE